MRIRLESQGGFGGLTVTHQLDTAASSPETSRQVQTLVAAALDAERAKHTDTTAPPARDALVYTIVVEADGAAITLTGSEATASPEARALLGFLRAYALRKRARKLSPPRS